MVDMDTQNLVDVGAPTQEVRMDATAEVPIVLSGNAGGGEGELAGLFGEEEDEWPTQGPAKGLRIPWPMAVLLMLLVAFGGIWGGAYLQRHSSSSASTSASPFGGSFPFPGGATAGGSTSGGARGFPGAPSSAASGTVTDIIGNTLYVTDASGNLVSVVVGTNTAVNRNAKSSLSALQPGDTVTVQGTKSKDGTVTASSVSATQAGVSSGGFAGFGGLGAGGSSSGSGG